MTISTIVTVYNLEKFIEESLESIFSQTRPADEIIVVDDCSTDRSAEVLAKYSGKIKYVKMPVNSGVLMAFIRGIEEASGDILTFLDGDDIWFPNKLEEVEKAFLEDDSRILVTHDYECIDGSGNPRPYTADRTHFNTKHITEQAKNPDEMNKLLRHSLLSLKGVWLGSAFSLRADCLDLTEFKELMMSLPDPGLSHQDQPIAAFVVLKNQDKKVYFINKILFKYRVFGFNSSGVSNDVKSALRTVNRSKSTLLRTSHLVGQHPQLVEENKRQKLLMQNILYLEKLYKKEYLSAFQDFCKLSADFWTWREKAKEFQRFVGVAALGPEKFLELKSKKYK